MSHNAKKYVTAEVMFNITECPKEYAAGGLEYEDMLIPTYFDCRVTKVEMNEVSAPKIQIKRLASAT